jgi:hypothetical protein
MENSNAKSKMMGVAVAAAVLSIACAEVSAHAIWTEPAEGGYKVYYGEPGEGLHENKEKLTGLGAIKIWDAAGNEVKGTLSDDHIFVKAPAGGLRASALEVDLYGKGEDAGKPFFYTRFTADAGKKIAPTPGAALEILPEGKDSVSFLVLKAGKPLAGEGLQMFAPDGWSKTFKTDANGKVRIEAPWAGTYVLEVGLEDKTPGKFKEKTYHSVWHAASLSFIKK